VEELAALERPFLWTGLVLAPINYVAGFVGKVGQNFGKWAKFELWVHNRMPSARARILCKGKKYNFGRHSTQELADKARDV